jgi:predicted amidohydrolase
MKIGVIQLQSVLDPNKNLETIQKFISEAKLQGIQHIFLPEVFYSMSDGTGPTPYLIEGENEHYQKISQLAASNNVFLLGGSVASKVNGKIINRNLNFDNHGKLLNYYDKIHLFSCDLSRHSSAQVINESDVYTAGNEMKVLKLGEWKMGLSICFDLRFAEMYREYTLKYGTNLLSISSAFTRPTGKAHWHTLVRARAIENQSYVVAANQWGEHNPKIKTFGHSLIIDPWGDVLADAGEGECLIVAELNLERVQEIRKRINCLT